MVQGFEEALQPSETEVERSFKVLGFARCK
jgi:hypothetical protein